MRIGVVFAMREELNAFLPLVVIDSNFSFYGVDIYKCYVNKNDVYLCLSSVGKVNASRSLQILIDKVGVDCVINAGVCGSVSKRADVLDVIVANRLYQHDFDISVFDHKKGYIPMVGDFVSCDKRLIDMAVLVMKRNDVNCLVGGISSGDKFINDSYDASLIRDNFDVIGVEMEGAAIGQVCFLAGIPFLVMRAVSDVVGCNNKVVYDELLNDSSRMIAKVLYDMLVMLGE